jgi:hypothetical protein
MLVMTKDKRNMEQIQGKEAILYYAMLCTLYANEIKRIVVSPS